MADDFFADIQQVELQIDEGLAKFPIFYRDARMFTLVLPANYLALKRMLPDRRFAPAQVLPGIGAIYLAAFEYYDTDIQPYNEFAIGILLNTPHYAGIPGYNMLRQYFAGFFNAFVYHLPVTTELALRAGRDFYNYPKFLADIDFSDSEAGIRCDLSRDGDDIMTITGGSLPTSRLGETKFICNLYQYRQPQQAEFKLNVVQGAIKWLPQNVSWEFNRANEIGRELSNAVAGTRALLYLYYPRIQCILYGPEHIPIPLMQYAITSPGFMPQRMPAGKKKSNKPPKP